MLILEKLQNIEEMLSILQNDFSSMSDELYNQQKNIHELKLQIKTLKLSIQNFEDRNKENTNTAYEVPPHY